ncbi:SSI family serine proteinase inhibitor [Streptomyces beihaiensis]|uniref:SSI family serine proteinase inhibitor n=1 Tax=Streptomyces beihaiensis TaxID=2984495 RepID=A0ABT3TMP0_9ACTN|nr:SSI family serine proteinase inhibitor [Streptomyces beihaiensis]MCX3058262.1 SSI family serine proteinase inhibitor [Streptomyces beihaiensis]
MRKYAVRCTTAVALTASCLASGAATARAAAPADVSTSKLVLAVGHSGITGRMVPDRVVTLECNPVGLAGDHPYALKACAELDRVDGAFNSLVTLNASGFCPDIYSPVTVTVDGYWKGRHVAFEHTFANSCVKDRNASYLFRF